MRKALYKQRMLARAGERIVPKFGTVPLLALILAFMAIHGHLATRVPITLFELPVLGFTSETSINIAVSLSRLGQSIFGGTLGARMPFVILAAFTSYLTYRTTQSLADDPIAPALSVVWLNTMLVFGLGSFLATVEAVVGFGVMLTIAGIVDRRHDRMSIGWWTTFSGVALLSVSRPEVLWAYIALVAVLAIRPRGRERLLHLGGLATTTLALLMLGLSGLPEFRYAVPSGEMFLILFAASVLAMGPGVLTFVGVGFTLCGRNAPRNRRRTGPLLAFMASLVAIVATLGVPIATLAALAGPAAVLAAITVADVRRFALNWIGEVTTPFAFLSFIVVAYLAANPENSVFQRFPNLAEPFGWDQVAAGVVPQIDATNAKWVATEDARLAERLRPIAGVETRPLESMTRTAICSGPGLLVTHAMGAETVFGQFRMFRHLGDVSRASAGVEYERLRIFQLGEPTAAMGCG